MKEDNDFCKVLLALQELLPTIQKKYPKTENTVNKKLEALSTVLPILINYIRGRTPNPFNLIKLAKNKSIIEETISGTHPLLTELSFYLISYIYSYKNTLQEFEALNSRQVKETMKAFFSSIIPSHYQETVNHSDPFDKQLESVFKAMQSQSNKEINPNNFYLVKNKETHAWEVSTYEVEPMKMEGSVAGGNNINVIEEAVQKPIAPPQIDFNHLNDQLKTLQDAIKKNEQLKKELAEITKTLFTLSNKSHLPAFEEAHQANKEKASEFLAAQTASETCATNILKLFQKKINNITDILEWTTLAHQLHNYRTVIEEAGLRIPSQPIFESFKTEVNAYLSTLKKKKEHINTMANLFSAETTDQSHHFYNENYNKWQVSHDLKKTYPTTKEREALFLVLFNHFDIKINFEDYTIQDIDETQKKLAQLKIRIQERQLSVENAIRTLQTYQQHLKKIRHRHVCFFSYRKTETYSFPIQSAIDALKAYQISGKANESISCLQNLFNQYSCHMQYSSFLSQAMVNILDFECKVPKDYNTALFDETALLQEPLAESTLDLKFNDNHMLKYAVLVLSQHIIKLKEQGTYLDHKRHVDGKAIQTFATELENDLKRFVNDYDQTKNDESQKCFIAFHTRFKTRLNAYQFTFRNTLGFQSLFSKIAIVLAQLSEILRYKNTYVARAHGAKAMKQFQHQLDLIAEQVSPAQHAG